MSERGRWLDHPRNVTRLVYGLYAACGLLLLADFAYAKHVHFAFEGWFGFFAVFGFVAYVAIVSFGKVLRRLVRRAEDYYGPPEHDDE